MQVENCVMSEVLTDYYSREREDDFRMEGKMVVEKYTILRKSSSIYTSCIGNLDNTNPFCRSTRATMTLSAPKCTNRDD